jgi:hypothetical protein
VQRRIDGLDPGKTFLRISTYPQLIILPVKGGRKAVRFPHTDQCVSSKKGLVGWFSLRLAGRDDLREPDSTGDVSGDSHNHHLAQQLSDSRCQ